ncbi:hypothetical protein ACQP10_14680 [Streptosporangium sandarakinum]
MRATVATGLCEAIAEAEHAAVRPRRARHAVAELVRAGPKPGL